jgi:hypothetical protein
MMMMLMDINTLIIEPMVMIMITIIVPQLKSMMIKANNNYLIQLIDNLLFHRVHRYVSLLTHSFVFFILLTLCFVCAYIRFYIA